MASVTVNNKYQVVIPQRVREQLGLKVGDVLDARAHKGTILFTPRSVADRAIAEGLADAEEGRVHGPFESATEMLSVLKRKRNKRPSRSKNHAG